jgi:hypothetical protein
MRGLNSYKTVVTAILEKCIILCAVGYECVVRTFTLTFYDKKLLLAQVNFAEVNNFKLEQELNVNSLAGFCS